MTLLLCLRSYTAHLQHKDDYYIACAFTVTREARSVGAHPLSGIQSWQGIAKYRLLCVQDTEPTAWLHFANLPQARGLVLIYS